MFLDRLVFNQLIDFLNSGSISAGVFCFLRLRLFPLLLLILSLYGNIFPLLYSVIKIYDSVFYFAYSEVVFISRKPRVLIGRSNLWAITLYSLPFVVFFMLVFSFFDSSVSSSCWNILCGDLSL